MPGGPRDANKTFVGLAVQTHQIFGHVAHVCPTRRDRKGVIFGSLNKDPAKLAASKVTSDILPIFRADPDTHADALKAGAATVRVVENAVMAADFTSPQHDIDVG